MNIMGIGLAQDTIKRIQTANRTCDLILGAGDGKAKTFRAFEVWWGVCGVQEL